MPHFRSLSRIVVSSLLLLGLTAGSVADAQSSTSSPTPSLTPGVYTVYSCLGSGSVPNAAAGWVDAAGGGATAANDCLSGGGLEANLTGPTPAAASAASWTFTAPAGTSIVDVAAQRQTSGVVAGQDAEQHGAPTYNLYLDNTALDSCDESNTSQCQANLTAPISRQGLAGQALSFQVQCGSSTIGPPCQNAIGADFTQVAIGLRDPTPPAVSAVHVSDNGQLSGTLRLTYNATDVGSGVYRTIVKADGTIVGTTLISPGTSCTPANPSDGNAFEFTVPVPCPLSVNGVAVSVPVSGLPPGPHSLEIDVQDAAGNTTTVYGPVPFPALNPATTGVSPAAVTSIEHGRLKVWFVANHRRRFAHLYGTRVVTRGVLTNPEGQGIVGAKITIYHIIDHGKVRLLKTGLKTRAGGRITLILPLNLTTRNIEYEYQALIPGPITARQTLHLTVNHRR
ncbi:MAG TPA: hypothetical protein VHX88_16615 [Solirubrobacteraceae bacterium]|nr:hypothetical protein [Solirubrobacteraceae bacterium]